MDFIKEVYSKRKKLADVLSDEEYSGIRVIVEDLYPEQAHFIYELLQNAEDAKATKASFELEKEGLIFKHNGRPFNEEDVSAITNIGKSDKKDQDDKIGRFGVGFKAVFSYTETPYIWSPTYSFKITGLVLPEAIPKKPKLGQKTCFEFPFNSLKKSSLNAYQEVEGGFQELAETTLLFLSNLQSISWKVGRNQSGVIDRIEHSQNHIEVVKRVNRKAIARSHFLRFSAPVQGLESQRVALAFALGFFEGVTEYDSKKDLAEQLKVIPVNPGRVAVFFPAIKETSGLRFHIHAPFVPELSRASIKESVANEPLFKQLAELAAASLHSVRDLKLLTDDFLGVLPNPTDTIPTKYQPIRSAIIKEMRNQPLTPIHQSKAYAPAKHLLQARASLKELLSNSDLKILVDCNDVPLRWVRSAAQKNSHADRFLVGLDITKWNAPEFISVLQKTTSIPSLNWFYPVQKHRQVAVMEWLREKKPQWHQQMYALLHAEIARNPRDYKQTLECLKNLKIIRLKNGDYSVAAECYFQNKGSDNEIDFLYVDEAVYSSGKSQLQKEDARKLLEKLGVREVDEADQIKAILKRRYTQHAKIPSDNVYLEDLKRFIKLVEKDQTQASMFSNSWIFKRIDGQAAKPNDVFLDSPYLKTGLSSFYRTLGQDAKKSELARWYQNSQLSLSQEKFVRFAQLVGVQYQLEIIEIKCDWNDKKDYLHDAPGDRKSDYGLDQDYYISNLAKVIEARDIELSRLLWNTMKQQSRGKLIATYRKSRNSAPRTAPSLLINWLSDRAWIPQGEDFVRPAEASRELLPKGFYSDSSEHLFSSIFDGRFDWLDAIGFGKNQQQKSEEHKKKQASARELGFADLGEAEWFTSLPVEVRQRIREETQRKQSFVLPTKDSGNPERRAERVGKLAADAPNRKTEHRPRSVSVGQEKVKEEAEQYLRTQYITLDGEMICQICQERLPFKLNDGNYFFEKVEFLKEEDLSGRHHQNYLALCPNHSAMFRHVNNSREDMKEMFLKLEGNELTVILSKEKKAVYFTSTHIVDLLAVIKAEQDSQ